MWSVLMNVAEGADVTDQLQLLVAYCAPDMDRLASEGDGVKEFFKRGSVQEIGATISPEIMGLESQAESPRNHTEEPPAEGPQHNTFGEGWLGDEPDSTGEMHNASGLNPAVGDGVEPNTDLGAAAASGLESGFGSPLSILSDSEDDSESSLEHGEHPLSPHLPLTPTNVKFSSRVVKPPKIFTSGATLTKAPSKKRKTERETTPEITDTNEPISPGTLFWTSTLEFHSAAASPPRHLP